MRSLPLRRAPALMAIAPLIVSTLSACASTKPTVASGAPRSGTRSGTASPGQQARADATHPLTGLPVRRPSIAGRPALSVKIDNVKGSFPQAGLNDADIVCDVLVEGGLTRLLAVYQSHDAPLVGPIRSARPVDADLVRLWGGGVFAYSGAADGEIAPMIDHGQAVRIAYDDDRTPFRQLRTRPHPHHVFAATPTLYAVGRARGTRWEPPPRVFAYGNSPLAGSGVPRVILTFSPRASAQWQWTGQTYVRSQDGRPDVLVDRAAVRATNVVIVSAAVAHTGIIDTVGEEDPLDVVIGSGSAWVMRGGRMLAGRWERGDVAAPMRLVDAGGRLITLQPGTTWLEVLPLPHTPAFR